MAEDRTHSTEGDVAASYDAVPYRGQPVWQSHPEWIGSVARLFALPAAPVGQCRILEVGCADGANVLPMAVDFPDSRFVGLDISSVQVAMANRDAAELSLRNIEFRAEDILELKTDLGQFDYIICHGVFSWVRDEVRDRLLQLIADHLSPKGLAFVSYNTKPGWHMRGVVREMTRYRTRHTENPREQIEQAKSILQFVAENAAGFHNEAYRALLREEVRSLKKVPDHYIAHEHLEHSSQAFYLYEFVESIEDAGLSYVSDSEIWSLNTSGFTEAACRGLNDLAGNLVEREQYLDFLRNRPFRQALIRRRDRVQPDFRLSPDRLKGLSLSCNLALDVPADALRPNANAVFKGPNGQDLSRDDPFLAAALVLAREYPAALSFESLIERTCSEMARWKMPISDPSSVARRLGRELLATLTTAAAIRLSTVAGRFTVHPSAQPLASPVARLEAAKGRSQITNGRHERVPLEPSDIELLMLLDGSNDASELASRTGLAPADIAARIVRLARSALIVA